MSIGLLGDGAGNVFIKRDWGLYLLIACCLSLIFNVSLYAATLFKKIDSRLVRLSIDTFYVNLLILELHAISLVIAS